MTDLYRIDLNATNELGAVLVSEQIKASVLVPVEPCEHGNIEGHYWQGKDLLEWCRGAGIGDGG